MRFGADVNAYTSFDETVFMLQIPTDNPAVIDRRLDPRGLGRTTSPSTPRRSTRSAASCSRSGGSAAAPTRACSTSSCRSCCKGSRYAERLPIGTPDIIRTLQAAIALKQFYKDWYRPDLMAVIAVGDFDKAAVEAMIRTHFDRVPKAVSPRPRPRLTCPSHPGTRFTIATDPEATNTVVNVSSKMPARDQTTVGMYRQQTAERVCRRAPLGAPRRARLEARCAVPGGRDQPRAVRADGRDDLAHRGRPRRRHRERPRGALHRSRSHGALRLHRGRARALQGRTSRAPTSGRRLARRAPVEPLADEYIRNFMQDEPIPGINYEFGAGQAVPPGAHPRRGQHDRQDWIPERNRVVAISAPKKPGVTIPDEARLLRDHRRRQRRGPHRLQGRAQHQGAPRQGCRPPARS